MTAQPFSRDEFLQFLVEAKRRTYAAQGDDATMPALVSGSMQLEYGEWPFLYRDIYFGMGYFVGQETVYYEGRPLWSMSYAGGVEAEVRDETDIRAIYAFLRSAMRQVTTERPFRGPSHWQSGACEYQDESHGEVECFYGQERVLYQGRQVYELRYHGGLLR